MSVVQLGTAWYKYLFVPRTFWYRLVQHPLGVYLLYQVPKPDTGSH